MVETLHTQPIETVCRELDLEDKEQGKSFAAFERESQKNGDNFIPPPLPCPAWLCCLLPCLKNTELMRLHRENVPGDAWKLMNANGTLVASEGLVRGDVVEIDSKNKDNAIGKAIVPCDIILFDVSPDFEMDRAPLTGEMQRVKGTIESDSESILTSSNTALLGTVVTQGRARGIAFAVGENTQWVKM